MPRVEFIRDFKLFDVSYESPVGNVLAFPGSRTPVFKTSDEFGDDSFCNFPIIVLANSKTWAEATLFFLEKLKQIPLPESSTLRSLAYDLKAFRTWIDDEKLDYCDVSARHRLALPTYKFMRYLRDLIKNEELENSTACRRMGVVVQFYRWLQSTGKVIKKPLWKETRRTISNHTETGIISQEYITTDLVKTLRKTKLPKIFTKTIQDGEALRPLSLKEIGAVRNHLVKIGNIEMELAFEIALTTGARIQTVFTLRKENFTKTNSKKSKLNRIAIGGNSPVKSKYSKEHVLLVPEKIMERMRIYLKSERYLLRVKASKHERDNPNDEYAFLTKYGNAYYLAKDDPNLKLYGTIPDGGSVRSFIGSTLQSRLKLNGQNFPLKFHDLRATFGVHLVELRRRELFFDPSISAVAKQNVNYLFLLNYVRERMGHSSLAVTERYLTFCSSNEMNHHIQAEFEAVIFEHIDKAA